MKAVSSTTRKVRCSRCRRMVDCDVTEWDETHPSGVAHINYSFHCGHYRNVRRA